LRKASPLLPEGSLHSSYETIQPFGIFETVAIPGRAFCWDITTAGWIALQFFRSVVVT
jgi:hypothetical protein